MKNKYAYLDPKITPQLRDISPPWDWEHARVENPSAAKQSERRSPDIEKQETNQQNNLFKQMSVGKKNIIVSVPPSKSENQIYINGKCIEKIEVL